MVSKPSREIPRVPVTNEQAEAMQFDEASIVSEDQREHKLRSFLDRISGEGESALSDMATKELEVLGSEIGTRVFREVIAPCRQLEMVSGEIKSVRTNVRERLAGPLGEAIGLMEGEHADLTRALHSDDLERFESAVRRRLDGVSADEKPELHAMLTGLVDQVAQLSAHTERVRIKEVVSEERNPHLCAVLPKAFIKKLDGLPVSWNGEVLHRLALLQEILEIVPQLKKAREAGRKDFTDQKSWLLREFSDLMRRAKRKGWPVSDVMEEFTLDETRTNVRFISKFQQAQKGATQLIQAVREIKDMRTGRKSRQVIDAQAELDRVESKIREAEGRVREAREAFDKAEAKKGGAQDFFGALQGDATASVEIDREIATAKTVLEEAQLDLMRLEEDELEAAKELLQEAQENAQMANSDVIIDGDTDDDLQAWGRLAASGRSRILETSSRAIKETSRLLAIIDQLDDEESDLDEVFAEFIGEIRKGVSIRNLDIRPDSRDLMELDLENVMSHVRLFEIAPGEFTPEVVQEAEQEVNNRFGHMGLLGAGLAAVLTLLVAATIVYDKRHGNDEDPGDQPGVSELDDDLTTTEFDPNTDPILYMLATKMSGNIQEYDYLFKVMLLHYLNAETVYDQYFGNGMPSIEYVDAPEYQAYVEELESKGVPANVAVYFAKVLCKVDEGKGKKSFESLARHLSLFHSVEDYEGYLDHEEGYHRVNAFVENARRSIEEFGWKLEGFSVDYVTDESQECLVDNPEMILRFYVNAGGWAEPVIEFSYRISWVDSGEMFMEPPCLRRIAKTPESALMKGDAKPYSIVRPGSLGEDADVVCGTCVEKSEYYKQASVFQSTFQYPSPLEEGVFKRFLQDLGEEIDHKSSRFREHMLMSYLDAYMSNNPKYQCEVATDGLRTEIGLPDSLSGYQGRFEELKAYFSQNFSMYNNTKSYLALAFVYVEANATPEDPVLQSLRYILGTFDSNQDYEDYKISMEAWSPLGSDRGQASEFRADFYNEGWEHIDTEYIVPPLTSCEGDIPVIVARSIFAVGHDKDRYLEVSYRCYWDEQGRYRRDEPCLRWLSSVPPQSYGRMSRLGIGSGVDWTTVLNQTTPEYYCAACGTEGTDISSFLSAAYVPEEQHVMTVDPKEHHIYAFTRELEHGLAMKMDDLKYLFAESLYRLESMGPSRSLVDGLVVNEVCANRVNELIGHNPDLDPSTLAILSSPDCETPNDLDGDHQVIDDLYPEPRHWDEFDRIASSGKDPSSFDYEGVHAYFQKAAAIRGWTFEGLYFEISKSEDCGHENPSLMARAYFDTNLSKPEHKLEVVFRLYWDKSSPGVLQIDAPRVSLLTPEGVDDNIDNNYDYCGAPEANTSRWILNGGVHDPWVQDLSLRKH